MTNDHESNALPPEPLRAPLPPAKPYPVDALGEILGSAATALHESIKAPLSLCCQSVLASASLEAQSHFDVALPWGGTRPLSLFLLTTGVSGERKSSVDEVVLAPTKAQEKLEMEGYGLDLQLYERDLTVWKVKNEQSIKNAARKSNAEQTQNVDKTTFPNKPMPPVKPVRLVSDPTIEGLFDLLSIGQPSVGLFSDEGGLLIGGYALNRDNALKTLARWCKFWDGAPFDRVRKSDGTDILYGRRMCFHQLATPDVMSSLLTNPTANGQGFLARCLIAWPESTIGNRQTNEFFQASELTEIKNFSRKLEVLTRAERKTGKSKQELTPHVLQLDDEAKALALEAYNDFETSMRKGNQFSEITDRVSKALENAIRIAGILTVIERGVEAKIIKKFCLARGLALMKWYLEEVIRIQKVSCVPQSVIDAESLSFWLKSRNISHFRTSPLLTYGPNQLRNKTRLLAAIAELLNNGYLIQNKPGMIIDGKKSRLSWTVLHYVEE